MSKITPREVLAVRRLGPDYSWFHLIVDSRVKSLTVHDECVTWVVDETVAKAVAFIRMERYKNHEDKTRLQVKRVKIVGSSTQIQNLLHNLGFGTPNQVLDPYWKKDEDEDEYL